MPTITNIEQRQQIERQVVRNLIRTAKKAGYSVVKVWDGGEMMPTTTETAAMEAVFAVDESRIYFKHPEEQKAHCACIVLGNDGWDAIADASMGERWDPVIEANSQYADRLCMA